MTPKQEAALRQAREALQYVYEGANNQGPHTGISWRCASNKVEPVIAAIDEALAEQPAIKPWVELTAMEIEELGKPYQEKDKSIQAWGLFACAVDEKLKEKNA